MKRRQMTAGSLTVETILVMPLCIMVIVIFFSFFQILQLQLKLQSALEQTVQQQAIYAGTQEDGSYSYLGAEGEFLALCQSNQVDFSAVELGAVGLHLLLNEEANETLEGTLIYRMQLPFLSFLSGQLLCVQSTICRIWSGIELSMADDGTEMVYYTEYGRVLHRYVDCSYLKLSISPISEAALPMARNAEGKRYKACELCGGEPIAEVYYITEDGDRFHSRLTCPGLSRYIKTASIEQAQERGLPFCSRCEKRSGKE